MSAAFAKRRDYLAGSTVGSGASSDSRPRSASCSTTTDDERLHDAAGAEAIGGRIGVGRRHPTEADDARPGAEPGAIYVQDRSREVRARIAAGRREAPAWS